MSSAQTIDTQARIAQLRAKAEAGTANLEDYKEAVRLIKGDRTHAHIASETARRSKAKAAVPSADDMLDELGK